MELIFSSFILYTYLSILFLLIVTKKINFAEAAVASIPLTGHALELGLRLSYFQFFIFLATLRLFLSNKNLFFNKYLIIYFTYAIIITLITSLFFIEAIPVKNGGYFREDGRFIAQIILLSFFGLNSIIVFSNQKNRIKKTLKIYVNAIAFMCVLALLQFIIWINTGFDIFPIERIGYQQTAITKLDFGQIIRVTGLAGEPKTLAAMAVSALIILLLNNRYEILKIHFSLLKIIIVIFVLFITLSTGGYIMFLASLCSIFLLDILKLKRIKLSKPKLIKLSLSLLIFFGILVRFGNSIWNVIKLRILYREDLLGEDFDVTVTNFLYDNMNWLFFGTGLGNVHNLAFPYIPKSNIYYMKDTIFVAKSGYLKLLSEVGIVGVLLFLLFISNLIFKLKKIKIEQGQFFFYLLFTFSLLFFLRGGYIQSEFYLIIGLATCYLVQRRHNSPQNI